MQISNTIGVYKHANQIICTEYSSDIHMLSHLDLWILSCEVTKKKSVDTKLVSITNVTQTQIQIIEIGRTINQCG